MAKRRPNHRLVKIHRTYTVEEVASLFGVHRNTVRAWVKRGLPTIDRTRPMLIHGADLAAFLHARRVKNKQTCQPGELYCVRCRVPRTPAGDRAEYRASTRRLEITLPERRSRLNGSFHPSVNRDFEQEGPTDGSAQPEQ